MICKMVVLNIFSFNAPYYLDIMSNNGCSIKRIYIKSFKANVCVETTGHSVMLIASKNGNSVYKTIYLNNFSCQRVSVNFQFNITFLNKSSINIITLNDANWGFPIASGVLNFKSS